MSSPAQITANRVNALQSTGPQTTQGKATAARNSATHGLSSREFIVDDDSQHEFTEFMNGLHQDLQPVGELELDCFRNFAHAAWTLRRCRIADTLLETQFQNPHGSALLNIAHTGAFQLLDLYTRRAQRTYFRFLQELRRIQTERYYRLSVDEILELPPTPHEDAPSPLAETRVVQPDCRAFSKEVEQAHRKALQSDFEALINPPSRPTAFPTKSLPEQTKPIAAIQPAHSLAAG